MKEIHVTVLYGPKDYAWGSIDDALERLAQKNSGRQEGGGTDMQTGERDQGFLFPTLDHAAYFKGQVEKQFRAVTVKLNDWKWENDDD